MTATYVKSDEGLRAVQLVSHENTDDRMAKQQRRKSLKMTWRSTNAEAEKNGVGGRGNFSNSPLDWNKARMWVMCTGATSRCGITLNKTHMNKYMWSSISAHSLTRLKSAQVLSLFQCWFYMPVPDASILQGQPKHIFMDLYSTKCNL